MNLTGHAVGALIPGIALLGISAGAMHLCRAAIPPTLASCKDLSRALLHIAFSTPTFRPEEDELSYSHS